MPIDTERLVTLANLINEKEADLTKLRAELSRLTNPNGHVTIKSLPPPREEIVTPTTTQRNQYDYKRSSSNPDVQKTIYETIKKSKGMNRVDIQTATGFLLGTVRKVTEVLIKRKLIYSEGSKRHYKLYAVANKDWDLKILPGKSVTILEKTKHNKPQSTSMLGKILAHINDNPVEIFDSKNNSLLQYCTGKFNHSQLAYCLDTLAKRGFIRKNIPSSSKERVSYNSLLTEPIQEVPKVE